MKVLILIIGISFLGCGVKTDPIPYVAAYPSTDTAKKPPPEQKKDAEKK